MARSSASSDDIELYWGLDIGGSTALLGHLSDSSPNGFQLVSELSTSPEGDPEDLLRKACEAIESEGPAGPAALGIGLAGLVDYERGLLLRAPNLPAWEGFPVRDAAHEMLRRPVVVDNDSNVFAVGAVGKGEIPSEGLWMVITLGTGIGGTIILDGRIVRGRGQAGEVGHMTLNPDGLECPCGSNGCWERYAGKSALQRYYEERGGTSRETDPRTIAGLAREGDEAALGAFEELGRWLGIGFANVSNCLFPEGIALGGGLTGAFDLVEEPARREFFARAMIPSWNIRLLEMAMITGALGAALLGRHLVSGVPWRRVSPRARDQG
jgi:glucokinase